VCFIILVLAFNSGLAQDRSEIILTIDDTGIPVEDYLYFLDHNDPDRTKSTKENSDAFIAYQLKLYEARNRGYDSTQAFRDELAEYRDLVASDYLDFARLNEKNIKKYYSRILKELEVSHIQVSIRGDFYRDTLAAYRKIDSIYQMLINGADFKSMAVSCSDARTAKDGGYLGFIPGMQISFPLEELAFNTAPGEISDIFRTSTAYHLIKINQKRESRGAVRLARIFRNGGKGFPDEHNQKVLSELDSIRSLLVAGADFISLAYKHSDFNDEEDMEPELPWIRSGGRQEIFVNAAFDLDEDGEISPIIHAPEGYYIIKRLEFKPVPGLQGARDQIRHYYLNNPSRLNYLRDRFLRDVMNAYGFNFHQDAYERFVKYGRNSFLEGKWIEPSDLDKERVLFTIGDKDATYLDFSDYLGNQQFAYSFINYPPVVGKHFQDFFLVTIKKYQKANLEARYPEFNTGMKNYTNALLISRVGDEIWEMASLDKEGLQNHYLKNREKYKVTGFEGMIIRFRDMKARQKLEFEINNSDLEQEELAHKLLSDNGELIEIDRVRVRKGENNIVDHFIWKQSAYKKEYSLIMVKGSLVKLPAETFDEAVSDVIIDYQKVVEESLIAELRKRYRVKLNTKLFKQI